MLRCNTTYTTLPEQKEHRVRENGTGGRIKFTEANHSSRDRSWSTSLLCSNSEFFDISASLHRSVNGVTLDLNIPFTYIRQ